MVEVKDINGADLEAMIAEGKNILVDFYFDNCGPCKMQKMILKEVAKNVENVEIATMELSGNAAVGEQYEIGTVPYLLYFQNGVLKERMMGMQQKTKLYEILNG